MSWDSYVDNLIGGGIISRAALIGLNGAVWTPAGAEKVLKLAPTEAATIGTTMAKKDPSVQQHFAANGVTVEGTRYLFLRDLDGDGRMVTFKKKDLGNLVLASTTQAVIIAFIPEAKADSARAANTAVENIVKYLEGQGY